MRHDAIMIKAEDNVATALRDLQAGQTCQIAAGKEIRGITIKEPIAYGHKFAVVDIPKGTDIIKYGEVMGRATAHISAGSHAHIHNIESLRGRGDLEKKG
jgi:altronate dehydratase small subunit